MKIAVVTMPVMNGRCEENFQYMIDKIERAIRDEADLVMFPQNAVSGYLLGDCWNDREWCRYVDSFNDRILDYSDKIAIVWGNIRYRGGRLFNCAFYAKDRQTHMRVKKNADGFLYRDSRYFCEQDIQSAIEFGDDVIALNFHDELQIADLNLNIDAQPYLYDQIWEVKGSCVYVNAVGIAAIGKNVVVYPGGSRVVVNRKLLYEAPLFQEAYALVDTRSDQVMQPQTPSMMDALCMAVREYDKQVLGGNSPWIIGLSGGLDSGINAALLTYALGKERVLAYQLSSSYNRSITIANARQEAEALGIVLHSGSIEKLTSATAQVLEEYGYHEKDRETLVTENIQARIRGHLLSTFAQIHHGVVCNNGNKVEVALGYCTLYGDAVGALGLIGDLTKVQLFDLAHEINARYEKEVIPASLLPSFSGDAISWEMPPSAELKDDQLDPMKWFYHDYLVEHLQKDMTIERFMRSYLDGSIWKSEIAAWMKYYGLDDPHVFIADLDWFISTMRQNAFKRLQTPPIIMISENAFGSRTEMQPAGDLTLYSELKEQILHLKK